MQCFPILTRSFRWGAKHLKYQTGFQKIQLSEMQANGLQKSAKKGNFRSFAASLLKGGLIRDLVSDAARGILMIRKKILYFAGCTANFMDTAVGKHTIHVLEKNGFYPTVPEQKCCGTPLISMGDKKSFLENARFNIESFSDQNCDIVTACTSCALTLKHDYPEYLKKTQC